MVVVKAQSSTDSLRLQATHIMGNGGFRNFEIKT
jgi:hypothetical protein